MADLRQSKAGDEETVRAGERQLPRMLLTGSRVEAAWPAKAYLVTEPLLHPLRRIAITTESKDQGWGNTGQSCVLLAVAPAASAAAATSRELFSIKDHDFVQRTSVVDESEPGDRDLLRACTKGSTLRLLMVAAPYPGFACTCRSASIELWYSFEGRYYTAVTRALLDRVAEPKSCLPGGEEDLATALLFCHASVPDGVFALITRFAFQ